MTPRKDDSLFQLSLTELAFILVFVVLLLIGAKLVLDRGESDKCVQERNECREALARGGGDPNLIIDSLVSAPKLRKELEESLAREQALKQELEAFEALRAKIPDPVRTKAAEDFLSAFEKDTKQKVTPDSASKQGEDAARLAKELANCRGQLKHCIRVTGSPKGYGLPPCWLDDSGQIQYLFNIEIRSDGFQVERAWPVERDQESAQITGIEATLGNRLLPLDRFLANTRPIFEASRRANPECRHYVIIRRSPTLRDIDQFNAMRLGIEDHFYKLDRTGTAAPQSP
jgi:hypothetical protein